MTPTANLATAEAEADPPAAPAAEGDSFVLNLCSSTTPMALAQTELPELKRFTFFVSRRFEEGRERFRLHMGFFASLAEAEEWLAVVREIYPGAWAGEAPGKKLRARAAEAAAAQARHAVGPQSTAAAAAAPKSAPPVARLVSAQSPPAAKAPMSIPTLHPPAAAAAGAPAPKAGAAPVVTVHAGKAASPVAGRRAPTNVPARRTTPAATVRPAAPPAASGPSSPQGRNASLSAAAQRAPARPAAARPPAQKGAIAPMAQVKPAGAPAAKPMQPSASRVAQQPAKKPLFADSNVKEVLAALGSSEDDAGETRLMPAPAGLGDGNDDRSLTDTQVLRYLETRRAADDARSHPAPQVDAAAESGISLLKPDDTGTRRALKEAVSQDDPVSFAVQLQWSVQPVALDKVPPLAIFSAYTLYSVEGSREGRKWYGLRLGFFNDAISAKQVAYYVRSEFTSVAVVPVSPQERERATEDNQRFSGAGASSSRVGQPGARRRSEDNEFKLIDLDEAPRAAQKAPAAAAVSQASQPPAARAGRKSGGTSRGQPGLVGARERRTPQTLEETLEILGANELAIDNGGDGSLSDTGVRHLRVEVQKNTPFSRLLERLSERVKKA
ncbi:MAG TPA: hypothetical protein VFN79_14495 [Steroidobacteraceae bacterium]|nr:hypothetical protein [Steroidobacteraceae bacterium]